MIIIKIKNATSYGHTVTTVLKEKRKKRKKKKEEEKTLLTYYAHTNYYIFKALGLGNVFKIDLKV